MKFQFSIARLLMATAMVALTFGLARLLLDKEISTFVILVAVFAADLGLLVLVAQKWSDLYRILRVIIFIFLCILSVAILKYIVEPNSASRLHGYGWMFLFAIGALLIHFFFLLSKWISKAEAKEIKRDRQQDNDSIKPKQQ